MKCQTLICALIAFAWTAAKGADASLITEFPAYPGLAKTSPVVVTAVVFGDPKAPRHYSLFSTAPQREAAPQSRTFDEHAGDPYLRSSNVLFDALFAQAIDDARLDSVASIRDDAYNDGKPIGCECFQTGEKWRYVWTRDLSYSSDLALAILDPTRTATSLSFKTSGFRVGAPLPASLPS